MSDVIIFLGGTGQEVMLNYFHLCRLDHSLMTPGMPKVYLIDNDTKGEDPDSKMAIIKKAFPDARSLFTILSPTTNAIQGGPGSDISTMLNLRIGSRDREILETFLEHQEMKQDTQNGFFAKPILGAISTTAMFDQHERIQRDHLVDPNNLFKPFVEFQNDIIKSSGRIFIINSIFGGTGAGVIGALIEYINQKRKNSDIILISILKSITLGDAARPDNPITNEDLQNANDAGMNYLKRLSNRISTMVLLAHPGGVTSGNVGGKDQPLTKSIVHLIAASAIKNNQISTKKGILSFFRPDSGIGFDTIKWGDEVLVNAIKVNHFVILFLLELVIILKNIRHDKKYPNSPFLSKDVVMQFQSFDDNRTKNVRKSLYQSAYHIYGTIQYVLSLFEEQANQAQIAKNIHENLKQDMLELYRDKYGIQIDDESLPVPIERISENLRKEEHWKEKPKWDPTKPIASVLLNLSTDKFNKVSEIPNELYKLLNEKLL
jgi:hypothetical protein